MLQQVLESIHNMFIKTPNAGEYTIAGGVISLPSLKEGQRFWIVGSDLNDGVYTYHASGITDDDDINVVGLQDETFAGSVCALAVPPPVIALTAEIKEWVVKYGDAVNSPYTSENVIGVYSYTKATAAKAGDWHPVVTWQDVYKSRLDRWRKVQF